MNGKYTASAMRLKICFILISLLLAPAGFSQGMSESRAFADALFEEGQNDQALAVYQRIAFFSRPATDPAVLLRIADCFYARGDLDKALEFYDHSYFSLEDDSLKTEALLQKAACYLRSRNYDFALIELLSLDEQADPAMEDKRNFYLGMTWFGLENFDQSASFFEKIPDNQADRDQIKALLNNRRLIHRPDPRLASWLSVFVPGAGQFYTGQPMAGINSLLLTGSLVALGFLLASVTSPLDALITALPWFQRYYQGGFQRAADFARIRRAENRNDAFNRILGIIESD
ncbi:MAG: tetratricopeptide repeat protein [Bacteroidales bacterium]